MTSSEYVPAVVSDYGTLVDLTEAISLFGPEDGASKLLPQHHTQPSAP